MRILFIALLLTACAKQQVEQAKPKEFQLDVNGISITAVGLPSAPLSAKEAKARASLVIKSK